MVGNKSRRGTGFRRALGKGVSHAIAVAVVSGTALAAPAVAKDTLIIAIPGTPQGVDLERHVSPQTWTMAAQLMDPGSEWEPTKYPYDPVAWADPTKIPGFSYPNFHDQVISPGIIEKCDLSDDGKAATFHLRKGVKSGAGNEFTAEDVLWKAQRSAGLKAIGAFLENIANAGDPGQWKKLDDYTVGITSDKPMSLICKMLTNMYFYWPDSTEAKKHSTADDPWATNWMAVSAVGFGPYTIKSWDTSKRVVMEANPNYWRGPPAIKHIVYQVVPESANRVALLKQGKVDLVEGLSPDEAASLGTVAGVRVAGVRGNQSIFAVLNNSKPPFSDVRVRQAINHLIPRDQIVNDIYRGLAVHWEGVMPSSYPGFVPELHYDFDVAKAKTLLAEAGLADGFKTTLSYSAGDPVQENVAILLKSTLAQAGISADLHKMPVAAHSDLVQSKNAEFALWIDFPIQPDPNYSVSLIYKTKNLVNYENYSNAQVDQILADGSVTVDTAKRNAMHAPAEDIISQEAAVGWIAETYYVNAMSDKITGWKWFTTQYYKVGEMTIE
jgi:peptide/nickel transport system substrate-binding protein